MNTNAQLYSFTGPNIPTYDFSTTKPTSTLFGSNIAPTQLGGKIDPKQTQKKVEDSLKSQGVYNNIPTSLASEQATKKLQSTNIKDKNNTTNLDSSNNINNNVVNSSGTNTNNNTVNSAGTNTNNNTVNSAGTNTGNDNNTAFKINNTKPSNNAPSATKLNYTLDNDRLKFDASVDPKKDPLKYDSLHNAYNSAQTINTRKSDSTPDKFTKWFNDNNIGQAMTQYFTSKFNAPVAFDAKHYLNAANMIDRQANKDDMITQQNAQAANRNYRGEAEKDAANTNKVTSANAISNMGNASGAAAALAGYQAAKATPNYDQFRQEQYQQRQQQAENQRKATQARYSAEAYHNNAEMAQQEMLNDTWYNLQNEKNDSTANNNMQSIPQTSAQVTSTQPEQPAPDTRTQPEQPATDTYTQSEQPEQPTQIDQGIPAQATNMHTGRNGFYLNRINGNTDTGLKPTTTGRNNFYLDYINGNTNTSLKQPTPVQTANNTQRTNYTGRNGFYSDYMNGSINASNFSNSGQSTFRNGLINNLDEIPNDTIFTNANWLDKETLDKAKNTGTYIMGTPLQKTLLSTLLSNPISEYPLDQAQEQRVLIDQLLQYNNSPGFWDWLEEYAARVLSNEQLSEIGYDKVKV